VSHPCAGISITINRIQSPSWQLSCPLAGREQAHHQKFTSRTSQRSRCGRHPLPSHRTAQAAGRLNRWTLPADSASKA
jgi:hypothetical protein